MKTLSVFLHPLDFCDPNLNFSKHLCMYYNFSNNQTSTPPPTFQILFGSPPLKNVVPLIIATFYLSIYQSIYILQKNTHIFTTKKDFNTVRNLITIHIVFIDKNGIDRSNPPPPPSKVGVLGRYLCDTEPEGTILHNTSKTPIKTKSKTYSI